MFLIHNNSSWYPRNVLYLTKKSEFFLKIEIFCFFGYFHRFTIGLRTVYGVCAKNIIVRCEKNIFEGFSVLWNHGNYFWSLETCFTCPRNMIFSTKVNFFVFTETSVGLQPVYERFMGFQHKPSLSKTKPNIFEEFSSLVYHGNHFWKGYHDLNMCKNSVFWTCVTPV